jgi:hypothetical protein
MGESAKLINRYQGDVVDSISLREELVFLPLFIKGRSELIADFQALMGTPLLPNGERRAITIMVANEGVLDLVLNFLCSCRASGINTADNLVVFVGQPELAPILKALGVRTFYSEAMGPIPKKAANFYGDNVFGVLMWLKATSIYVATNAGYDVLFQVSACRMGVLVNTPAIEVFMLVSWFVETIYLVLLIVDFFLCCTQDTDLVWMQDPLPVLRQDPRDIVFMDDGAR